MSGVMSDAPIGQGMTISDQLARHARGTPGRLAYRCASTDRT